MEHLHDFGLKRDPFVNDPLVRLYLATPQHAIVEKRIARGVTQSKGLCLLVGEPGSGKSMVARHLLEGLEEEAYEASLIVLVNSRNDERWLLTRIARQLGVAEPGNDSMAVLAQLYDRLAACREEGRRPVLIVDDAQNLDRRELLEVMHSLLKLEYEDQHLLTLLLVGTPLLEEHIRECSGLAESVEIRTRLEPMDPQTSANYLNHRLKWAEGDISVFEPEAVRRIHELGRGHPRPINTLADNALFEAHLAGHRHCTRDDVDRAARGLGWGALDIESLAETLEPVSAHEFQNPALSPAAEREPEQCLELAEEPRPEELPPSEIGSWLEEEPVLAAVEAADLEPAQDLVFEASSEPLRRSEYLDSSPGEDPVERDLEDLFEGLIEED